MRSTAKDTKLGRDVALKILPDVFARDPERPTAISRFFASALLLDLGKPAQALIQAQKSFDEAQGAYASWGSSYYRVIALARLGRGAEAAKAMDDVTARANALPSNREKRRVHWVAVCW